jgi:TRAP-type C4-dicarboxylate transport system permease small subunit
MQEEIMKKFFDVVLFVQRKICAVLLLAMIVVTTIQIVARVILHVSSAWTEELSRFLMIWITFIGGTGMLIKGEHLAVDFLSSMYTPSARKIARIVNNLIYTFFSGFMLIFGYKLFTNPITMRSLTPALQVPRKWIYVILPVCMVFMVLYSLYDLVLSVRALSRKNAAEGIKASRGGDGQ